MVPSSQRQTAQLLHSARNADDTLLFSAETTIFRPCGPSKFKLALLITILFSVALIPSTLARSIDADWVRTYALNPAALNQAHSMFLMRDGGIAVCGSSVNSNGNSDYLVIKYNADGSEAWTLRYDSTGDDRVSAATTSQSGYILITGSTKTVKISENGKLVWAAPYAGDGIAANNNFVYVTGFATNDWGTVKLKNDGSTPEVVWTRYYDGPARNVDIARAVAAVDDGAIVAGVETTNRPIPNSFASMAIGITRYSASGVEDWHKTAPVVEPFFPENLSVHSITVNATGAAYLSGLLVETRVLIKFDEQGIFKWRKYLHMDFNGDVVINTDNNVLVAGSDANGAVKMFDPDGNLVWSQFHVSAAGGRSEFRGLALDASGGVLAAGYTLRTPADNDAIVMKLNSAGAKMGTYIYDSPNHGSDFANDILLDAQGNIYVTGYSTTPQGGTEFLTLKYSSAASIQKLENGTVALKFLTTPAAPYALETTTDFLNWQSLLTNAADANGLVQFTNSAPATLPFRFYRGKAQQ